MHAPRLLHLNSKAAPGAPRNPPCLIVPLLLLLLAAARPLLLPPPQYDLGPFMLQNDLLAVPAGPGRSVAYTLGMSSAPRVTNWDIAKVLVSNPKQLMPTLFR